MADPNPRPDFFVSHATANRAWAEWIAVELEKAGYTTIVQSFDFRPGTDFVHQMQKAATTALRTIAVLSPAYLTSDFGEAEWRAAFATDPSGEKGLLIPVRVQPGDPVGLLATRVYVDFVGVNETAARKKLLAAVDRNWPRPTTAPFPGDQPRLGDQDKPGSRFPGLGAPISNLPARNRTFSGRNTALLNLYEGLQAESAAAVLPTTAVHGLGGVGKTALALEFAHRYASDYDLIWWVNAEQPTTATTDLVKLGNRLGLPQAAGETDTINQLFDHLRGQDRWLLVYDNAESPTTLTNLLPAGGQGDLVITSRWSTWARHAAGIPLDVLARQESIDFLRRRASTTSAVTNADDQVLAELAELVGDLPLALDEAAAYLDATHIHPADYIPLLRTRSRELFGLDNPGHDHDPDHDSSDDPDEHFDLTGRDQQRVATVWTLSLDKIRQQAPAAEGLLTLLAYLASDEVPRTLPTTNLDLLPEPLQTATSDPVTYNQVIATISRYSLAATTPTHLAMHRLVQAVIHARLNPDAESAWAAIAIELIDSAFPDESWEVTTWRDCERLLPHLLAVAGHALRLHTGGEKPGRLLRRASIYLRERGLYFQAKPVAEQALAITQNALGTDHIDVAWCHDELGRVLENLGEPSSSRHHYEQALRIGEAAHGPDHPDIGTWHSGLGGALRALGDLAGARAQYEQALRIGEAALEPDHPDIGTHRGHLGLVLRDLGDLAGAREQHEKALRISEAALGPTHPTIGVRRSNLGLVLQDLGDLAGAREQYEWALRISETALGPNHPDIGARRGNLGTVLHDLNDLAGAREQYERALRISETALGSDHPDISPYRSNLGLALHDLGDLTGAREQLEHALRISETALGSDHPDISTYRNNLSTVLHALGDHTNHRGQQEQALLISEPNVSGVHPLVRANGARLASLGVPQDENGCPPVSSTMPRACVSPE